MKKICIIPARGGSKRIPRKNIKPFLGKPIIAYSIQAAIESQLFDEVMVSTDDEEIAGIAKQYGAKVPFYRSLETSNDFAITVDVLNEVLNEYEKMGQTFDYICCIYPTALFITSEKLRSSFETMVNKGYDSAFAIVQYSYPIQRGLVINENERVNMIWPQYIKSRSQELTPTYHDAGQFYFSTVKKFRETNAMKGDNTYGIVTNELEVQDLDTMTDWELAELKYKRLLK